MDEMDFIVDYNSLLGDDGLGVGDALNGAYSISGEVDAVLADVGSMSGTSDFGSMSDMGGLGLGGDTFAVLDFVNGHGDAFTDAMAGDFDDMNRVLAGSGFLEGAVNGELAWDNAIDGFRSPFDDIADGNTADNEFNDWRHERDAQAEADAALWETRREMWESEWAEWNANLVDWKATWEVWASQMERGVFG
jgi:hypothetical protein